MRLRRPYNARICGQSVSSARAASSWTAAIAAVHAEAPSAEETDWPQIVILYELLERVAPNPMVTLNHAVAVAMARGPQAGLDLLAPLESDARMARHHRLAAVRAHLLEMLGDEAGALESYRTAARRTTSLPEKRYLEERAATFLQLPDRAATDAKNLPRIGADGSSCLRLPERSVAQ